MQHVTHKLFVPCLSSSGEHKDYCFWLCTQYFGHFTPVIHIHPSLSIQQLEGWVIFLSVNCTHFSQRTHKYVIVRFTQKTNYLIIVPTKTDWWIALDLFLQWIDPKLNFHIWVFFTPTSQLLFHFFNHFACLWKLLQQCSVSRLIQGFWFHDSWPRVERVVVRREGANRGHVIGITSERGSVEMIAL